MAKRVKASSTYLIADARERNVIPFLDEALANHLFVVKQVTTADYLICRQGAAGAPPAVLAAVERKTLEDFAASFKDGRHANVQKLRALRAATGCQLYYFIEGPAFPSPSRRFARIPFSSILAAATKLMVRDGVFVVQTENEAHTAKRLADFLRVFDAEGPADAPAEPAPAGAPADGPLGDAPEGAALADDALADDAEGGPLADALTVPDILTARIEQTDSEAAVGMWARLRGISVVLGKILTREFTIAELATQAVPPERIRSLKTATGRPINKDAAASLLAVRAGSHEHAVKLVSGLRNVTPAVAALILESAGGLARLCAQPAAAVAAVPLPQKTRTVRLGTTRAERIRRTLHYREGPVAPPDPTVGELLAAAGLA
jgi:hypothetical protein